MVDAKVVLILRWFSETHVALRPNFWQSISGLTVGLFSFRHCFKMQFHGTMCTVVGMHCYWSGYSRATVITVT